MSNSERKKQVDKFGVPDCKWVRCPKLDPVLKTTLLKEAIKADGYLSRLHQFWLNAVVLLASLIESADVGDLTVGGAVAVVQSALLLMGKVHQSMEQKRRKKLLLQLNPAQKSLAEEEKTFQNVATMLFGEGFAKTEWKQ